MRVAVMVVVMFAVTTPLQASQSCMSKTEARNHFSSSHIYWHGPDHCWDATPVHRHGIHGVRRHTPSREAERKRVGDKLLGRLMPSRREPPVGPANRPAWSDHADAHRPALAPRGRAG